MTEGHLSTTAEGVVTMDGEVLGREPEQGFQVPAAEFGTLEVADPYDGLRALLDEFVGDRVILHVMNGGQVEGKVLEHADGIIKIKGRGTGYHVPIHMIVVVEESE